MVIINQVHVFFLLTYQVLYFSYINVGGFMNISGVPFTVTDWSQILPEEHLGEKGKALWKVFSQGNIRVRMVEYTHGYIADHWCKKGHVILVLEGEMTTELNDGRKFTTKAGCSYQVADDDGAHRTFTETGVKLFIVD
jgi:hypothetical protein